MNILIIRTSAIGDVFLSSQIAQYIKNTIPHATLHWLVEERCSAVLKNIKYIDKLILWNRDKKKGIKGIFDSAKEVVFDTEYDLVLDLQCLLKLFPVLKKIKAKKIIGISEYEFPMNLFYNEIIETNRFEPLKDKYLRIANKAFGYIGPALDPIISYSKEDKISADLFMKANNLDKVIACVFATSKEHKYWNRDKWALLGEEIKNKYNAKCLLFGAPADKEYADYLMSKSDNFISIVGKTSILESMAYLSNCIACVSTDTALMHFASVMNIPTISLYGTNFFYSHHLGRKNVEIVFRGDWNNKDTKVPDNVCKSNMENIGVNDIILALDKHI